MKKFKLKVILLAVLLMMVAASTSVLADAKFDVEETRKSVVRIVVSNYDAATKSYITYGQGSGFAIGKKGEPIQYIVTNDHVITGADKIELLGSEDDMIDLFVYFTLPLNDIAVLEFDVDERIHNMDPLPVNVGERAKVGDSVHVFGFPGVGDISTWTGKPEDVTVTNGSIGKISALTNSTASIEYYQYSD